MCGIALNVLVNKLFKKIPNKRIPSTPLKNNDSILVLFAKKIQLSSQAMLQSGEQKWE